MSDQAKLAIPLSNLRSIRVRWLCFVLVVGIMTSPLLLLLGPLWRAGQAILYAEIRGPRLERLYGFEVATPVLKFEDGFREVAVVSAIPGGFMHAVGVGDCDAILSHTRAEFYKMLCTSSGRMVRLKVVRVEDLDSPVQRGEARTLRFAVPN